MTLVYPAWSSDPGDLIAQAQDLFLKHRPDGTPKNDFSQPNLATPSNLLPLVSAQLEWLREFRDKAASYQKAKDFAEAIPKGWIGKGIIHALPSGSIADEADRAVERFEGYERELGLALSSGVCRDDCAYLVTEPYLGGWYPGIEWPKIPDVGTPALLIKYWQGAMQAWAETVVDALAGVPLDLIEEGKKRGGQGLDLLQRIAEWIAKHPRLTVGLAAGAAAAVVAGPYVAPFVQVGVRRLTD